MELAELYWDRGDLDKAEKMCREAMKKPVCVGLIVGEILELGFIYAHQGNLIKAEELLQEAKRGFEKEFGSDHKLTRETHDYLDRLHRIKILENLQMSTIY